MPYSKFNLYLYAKITIKQQITQVRQNNIKYNYNIYGILVKINLMFSIEKLIT